jgi:hypothetical protein
MEPFPFTETDWQRVRQATNAVLNATLIDDAILRASQFSEVAEVLEELRERYGDHHVLRETEADFLDDPALRLAAYREAIRVAEQNSLATLSTRISLARLLLEEFADPDQAAKGLAACGSELSGSADELEKQEWSQLQRQCKKLLHRG